MEALLNTTIADLIEVSQIKGEKISIQDYMQGTISDKQIEAIETTAKELTESTTEQNDESNQANSNFASSLVDGFEQMVSQTFLNPAQNKQNAQDDTKQNNIANPFSEEE